MSRKKKIFVRVNRYDNSFTEVLERSKEEVLIDISKYVGFHVYRDGYGRIQPYMIVYFDTLIESLQKMLIDMPSFERLKQFVTEV